MPRCRDCALYDLDAVKNARGAVMGNRAAKCCWKPKALPESVRNFYGDFLTMQKRYMPPNEIHRCATFVQRTNNG